MIESEKYIFFGVLNNLNIINLYTKKPLDINFHVQSQEELENKFLEIENEINYRFRKVVLPRQSHTTNVVCIDEDNLNDELVDVDGVITNLKGIALVTSSADCQNILIYDKNKKVIASVHSGWKGTLNKILRNTICIMQNKYECNCNDLIVCIEPSILKCCFEVEDDVVSSFKNNFESIDEYITLGEIKDNKQKYYIDTVGINKMELLSLGVLEKNIFVAEICTKCNNDKFHSYRAAGKGAGRNIALICICD